MVTGQLLAKVLPQDRQLVADQIAAMEHVVDRAEAIGTCMEAWVTDPGTREWLLEIAARHDVLQEVREELMRSWARQDPAAATGYLLAVESVTEEERTSLEVELLAGQTRRDPQGAVLGWFGRHPAEQVLGETVCESFVKWAGVAPEAATAWLDALPAGERRDVLSYELLSRTYPEDIGAATRRALGIGNEAQRHGALHSIHSRLLNLESPEETKQWLEALPASEQENIKASRTWELREEF